MKFICSYEMNKKQRINSLTKTWLKDISHHQTPPTVFQHLWSLKRTLKRNGTLLTITPSMRSLGKMSPHSPTSNNVLKTYRGWNYSVNSTSAGVITTSEYMKETNGKLLSKPTKDYSNQK